MSMEQNDNDGSPLHAFRVLTEIYRESVDKYATAEHVVALVQHALKSAQEHQQDIEAIEAYGRLHPTMGPSIFFSDGWWRGHITEELSSLCSGESYAEVLSTLATWCRAELAK